MAEIFDFFGLFFRFSMKVFILFFFCIFAGFFDLLYIFIIFLFFMFCFLFWGVSGFRGIFCLDEVSFFLLFLRGWIFVFCFSSQLIDKWGSNHFFSFRFFLGSIFLFLLLSFSCLRIFVFYVCFEFIFLLIFLFLLRWGYRTERLQASFYIVFYTLVVSFPFLVYVVLSGFVLSSISFKIIFSFDRYWWFFLFCVFMVKLPVFGVHLWLPKAHVEAPVSGSMVLAGVLLKLGAYGFLRFFNGILIWFRKLGGYLVSLGLLGGILRCFLCLRQVDIKAFIAYSSVCHMGIILGGLCVFSYFGECGGVFMLIGHGFCSSCLFYILYVVYERYHSRRIMILKGILFIFPLVGLIWFVFCALNIGVPPSLNFFSEIFLVIGLGNFDLSLLIPRGVFLFFAGVYGIYLFIISSHGVSFLYGCYGYLRVREFLVSYGHFWPILFISLFLGFFF